MPDCVKIFIIQIVSEQRVSSADANPGTAIIHLNGKIDFVADLNVNILLNGELKAIRFVNDPERQRMATFPAFQPDNFFGICVYYSSIQ